MLDVAGTQQQRFDPHSLGLRFPLAVGKAWQGKSRRFDEARLVGTYAGAYRVVGVRDNGTVAGPGAAPA